jgi:tetratricopeptide (TPR) repeat protein
MGEFSEAELSFTHCIALYPSSPQGYFLRGLCRLEHGRPGPAEQDFSRVIQLRPETYEAFLNRAIAYQRLGRYQAALADCNQALQGNRAHVRILALRSQILDKLNRHEEALADREAALGAEPGEPEDWVRRGLLRIDDDPAAAAADFAGALALQPDHLPALQNLAHVYADALHDNDHALDVLRQFAEFFPKNPTARAGQAVVLARMVEYEAAAQQAESALQISRNPTTCYQVASAFALLSQHDPKYADRAIALVRECLQQDASWFAMLIEDEDFRPLRENQEFLKLLAAVDFLMKP